MDIVVPDSRGKPAVGNSSPLSLGGLADFAVPQRAIARPRLRGTLRLRTENAVERHRFVIEVPESREGHGACRLNVVGSGSYEVRAEDAFTAFWEVIRLVTDRGCQSPNPYRGARMMYHLKAALRRFKPWRTIVECQVRGLGMVWVGTARGPHGSWICSTRVNGREVSWWESGTELEAVVKSWSGWWLLFHGPSSRAGIREGWAATWAHRPGPRDVPPEVDEVADLVGSALFVEVRQRACDGVSGAGSRELAASDTRTYGRFGAVRTFRRSLGRPRPATGDGYCCLVEFGGLPAVDVGGSSAFGAFFLALKLLGAWSRGWVIRGAAQEHLSRGWGELPQAATRGQKVVPTVVGPGFEVFGPVRDGELWLAAVRSPRGKCYRAVGEAPVEALLNLLITIQRFF